MCSVYVCIVCMIGDLMPDLDQGLNELLYSLWCYWWIRMLRYIPSQRFSIGLKPVECEGQWVTSMPLSFRNCLDILVTWGQALSCTRRNPGSSAPVSVQPSKDIPPLDHHWPTAKTVMLDDVTGSITFLNASLDSFPSVICAQRTCSHSWRERSASSGVLWQMPIELHCAGL